jgi:hypothetical protein
MKNITLLNVVIFTVGLVFTVFNKQVTELNRQSHIMFSGYDPGISRFRLPAVVFGIFIALIGLIRLIG